MFTKEEIVSVPLRGKGRDQRARYSCGGTARMGVSVPLRGKGRDQRSLSEWDIVDNVPWFPSPCGEKVGINA